uniref:YLP motif-containing protein 1 n=1 Tax=Phallusia mammillata TaxID=59560 RepID=A0A6F9DXU3_9ASCI|nr:YLP motif-containing protein 1 [Phallusia mammillata]
MLPGWNQIRQQRLPSQSGVENQHHNQQWMHGNFHGQMQGMAHMAGGNFNPMMHNQNPEQQMMQNAQGDMGPMMNQPNMYHQQFVPQQQNMYQQQMMAAYQMNNQQGPVQPPDVPPPKQPPPPAPVPPPPPPSEDKPAPPKPPPPEAEDKWWVDELVKLNAGDKAKLERLTKEAWFLGLNKEQQVECWQHKLQLVSKQKKTTETAKQIKKEFVPAVKKKEIAAPQTLTNPTSKPSDMSQPSGSDIPSAPPPVTEWVSSDKEDPQICLAQYQQQLLKLTQQEQVFLKQYNDWHKQFDDWKKKHKDHPNKSQFAQYEKQWVTWQDQMVKQKTQNQANIERLRGNIHKIQHHLSQKLSQNSARFQTPTSQTNILRPNIPGGNQQQFSQTQPDFRHINPGMAQENQQRPRTPTSQFQQQNSNQMQFNTPGANEFRPQRPHFDQQGPRFNRPPFEHGQMQQDNFVNDRQARPGQNNRQQPRMGFAEHVEGINPNDTNEFNQQNIDSYAHDAMGQNNNGPRPRMPPNQRFRAPGAQNQHGPRFPGQPRPRFLPNQQRPRFPEGEEYRNEDQEFFDSNFEAHENNKRGNMSARHRRPRPRFSGQSKGRMPFRPKGPRYQGHHQSPSDNYEEHFDEHPENYDETPTHNQMPVRGPRPRFPGSNEKRFGRPMRPQFPDESPMRQRFPPPTSQQGSRFSAPVGNEPNFKEDDIEFGDGSFETSSVKRPVLEDPESKIDPGQAQFKERPNLLKQGSTSSGGDDQQSQAHDFKTQTSPDATSETGSKISLPHILANNPLFKGDNLKKLQQNLEAIKGKRETVQDGTQEASAREPQVDRDAILDRAKKLSNLDLQNILSAVKTVKEKQPSPSETSDIERKDLTDKADQPGTSSGADSNTLDKEAIEAALLQRLGLDPKLAKAAIDNPTADPLLEATSSRDTLLELAGIKDDLLMQEYMKLDPQLERELLLRAIRDRELLEEAQRLDPSYNQTLEMQWAEERRAEERHLLEMSALAARPFDVFGPPGPWHPMGPRGPPYMGPGRPPFGPDMRMIGPGGPPIGPGGRPLGPGPPMGPGGPFMGPGPPFGPGWSPMRHPTRPFGPRGPSPPPEEEKLFDIDGRELGKDRERDVEDKPAGDRRSVDDKHSRENSENRDRKSQDRSPSERGRSRQRDSIERGRQALHDDLETLKRHQEILGRERYEKEHQERSEQRERSLERLRAIEDDLRKREQLLLERERELQMARRRYSPGRHDYRERDERRPLEDDRLMEGRRRSPFDERRMPSGLGSPPRYDHPDKRSDSRGREFDDARRRHPDARGPFRGPPDEEFEHHDRRPRYEPRGPAFRPVSPPHHREVYRRSVSPHNRRNSPPMDWRVEDREFDNERVSPPRRINRSPFRERSSPKRERVSGRLSPRRQERRFERRTPPRSIHRSRSRSRSPPMRGNRDRFGRDVPIKRGPDPFGRDLNLRERSPKQDHNQQYGRNRDRPFPPHVRDRPFPPSPAQSSSGRGTPSNTGTPIAEIAASIKRKLLAPAFVNIADLIDMPGRMRRPAKIVVILRGLPGSGKTHIAKMIREKETTFGVKPRVLGLDDYFMAEVEKLEKDPDTGKKVKKKVFEYEYEPEMEASYRSNLFRSFKKTLDDGFFSFIIVDAVNENVLHFSEFYDAAKNQGFEAYIAEIKCDPHVCARRNIHKRTLAEIQKINKAWEETAIHMNKLDLRLMVQDSEIQEVEMGDASEEETDKPDDEDELKEESSSQDVEKDEAAIQKSKWESESTAARLDKLDGIAKKSVKRSMEDFLSLPDDYESRESAPGKKRVRWADLNERKTQQRMRDVGFVVGQTDWSRMMDDTHATRALNRTKFI